MSIVTDNYTIDLGDDSNLTLTKRIYDVQEPDKRQSHFTKTITVPSSKTNDLVFQGMFDVNFHLTQDDQFEPFFNPNKKANCILHTDTAEQMQGYAQLTDIVLNRYTNKVEYKVTLYGEIRDLFSSLTNKKLSELNLDKYDHAYTKAKIEDSWDYTVMVNGVSTNYAEGGNGYIYPMVDYGDVDPIPNGTTILSDYWLIKNFRPWVYCKTIVDAIFEESGFSYYSTFFGSSLFKKLIFQGDVNGLQKSETDIENLTINAAASANTDYTNIGVNRTPIYAYGNYPLIFDTETLDPAGQYNNANGIITISQTDTYNINADVYYRIYNNGGNAMDGNINLTFQLIDSNGVVLSAQNQDVSLFNNNIPAGSFADYTVSIRFTKYLPAATILKLVIRKIDHTNATLAKVTDIGFRFKTSSAFSLYPISEIAIGQNVSLSSILSDDMTCKDFMMGLVKMFNLYIEPYWFKVGDANSGNYNQYLIETRDDYFTNDVIDWTANLDTDKDFIIKPAALIDSKFFNFTYKDDNDYLNSIYKGQTGRIYGDYLHEIDNDFAKGVKTIEVPFSQCIVSDNQNQYYNRLMPVNMTQDRGRRVDGKPKILFYNGTIATANQWYFEGDIKSNYPLAHQVDDIFDPTTDLSFQVPAVIYHSGDVNGQVVFTNGTLFNKYYYRQVTETTDKNSKMIECYMRLRPADIHSLSFRPLYFINDAYYRLYEVVDHNYVDTTLCRFLKINEATPIANQTTTTRGGRGVIVGTTDKTPTTTKIPDDKSKGGFSEPGGVGGPGEIVIAAGATRYGYTDGISGNNVLQGGLSRNEIIKDNTISLGFQSLSIASGVTTLTGQEGSPLYIFADSVDGAVLITLQDYEVCDGQVVVVKKTDAANTVQVYDHTDLSIKTWSTDNQTERFFLTKTGVQIIT